MIPYYCPFCTSHYQFHKTRSDGIFICGQCGDPLIKKPFLNSRRIIGLIVTSAFLAPLIFMLTFVVKDLTREKIPNNYELLDQLTMYK